MTTNLSFYFGNYDLPLCEGILLDTCSILKASLTASLNNLPVLYTRDIILTVLLQSVSADWQHRWNNATVQLKTV